MLVWSVTIGNISGGRAFLRPGITAKGAGRQIMDMKHSFRVFGWFIAAAFWLGAVIAMSQPASAQTVTTAYILSGVTYSNTSGFYGVSTGDGMITWTYQSGDFQNGTGTFVYLNLPPYTVSPYYPTTYTVESAAITGQLASANVDSYSYDFSITFSPALSSAASHATITGGSYDLWAYNPDIGFGGNFLGKVIGGSVQPYQPPLSFVRNATNVVISWPTNYASGFVLQTARSLTGTNQWTASPLVPAITGGNYVVTNAVAPGTNTFFRLSK
jgi:hypothetical protein